MLPVAERAARLGGECLRQWRSRFSVHEKGVFDLVTDADHASQAIIRETLLTAFPDHRFLGEETPDDEKEELYRSSQPLWVVDPLDGTTNYVHGFPCYAVSIGLVVDGQVVLGVIYDPSRDEMFAAARGHGATLNQQPIRCSTHATLGVSLLAIGFPALLRGNEQVIEAWKWFGYETQGLRRTGSSALNLAYIASGRFDGFFAFQISPWDLAAGIVLVEEAGGRISQRDGSPYPPLASAIFVASNGVLHDEILRGVQAIPAGART